MYSDVAVLFEIHTHVHKIKKFSAKIYLWYMHTIFIQNFFISVHH